MAEQVSAAADRGPGGKRIPIASGLSRRHNDDGLVLPARFVSEERAGEIVRTWLETTFDGGRHERWVGKIEREGGT